MAIITNTIEVDYQQVTGLNNSLVLLQNQSEQAKKNLQQLKIAIKQASDPKDVDELKKAYNKLVSEIKVAEKGIKQYQTQMNSLTTGIRYASTSINDMKNQLEGLRAKYQEMTAQERSSAIGKYTAAEIEKLDQAVSGNRMTLNNFLRALGDLGQGYAVLSQEVVNGRLEMQRLGAQLAADKAFLASYQQQLDDLASGYQAVGGAAGATAVQTAEYNAAVEALRKRHDEAVQGVATLNDRISAMSVQVRNAQVSMDGYEQSVRAASQVMRGNLTSGFSSIAQGFQTIITSGQGVGKMLTKIGTTAKDVLKTMSKSAWAAVGAAIIALGKHIYNLASEVNKSDKNYQSLISSANQARTALATNSGIVQGLAGMMRMLGEAVAEARLQITGFLTGQTTQLKQLQSDYMTLNTLQRQYNDLIADEQMAQAQVQMLRSQAADVDLIGYEARISMLNKARNTEISNIQAIVISLKEQLSIQKQILSEIDKTSPAYEEEKKKVDELKIAYAKAQTDMAMKAAAATKTIVRTRHEEFQNELNLQKKLREIRSATNTATINGMKAMVKVLAGTWNAWIDEQHTSSYKTLIKTQALERKELQNTQAEKLRIFNEEKKLHLERLRMANEENSKQVEIANIKAKESAQAVKRAIIEQSNQKANTIQTLKNVDEIHKATGDILETIRLIDTNWSNINSKQSASGKNASASTLNTSNEKAVAATGKLESTIRTSGSSTNKVNLNKDAVAYAEAIKAEQEQMKKNNSEKLQLESEYQKNRRKVINDFNKEETQLQKQAEAERISLTQQHYSAMFNELISYHDHVKQTQEQWNTMISVVNMSSMQESNINLINELRTTEDYYNASRQRIKNIISVSDEEIKKMDVETQQAIKTNKIIAIGDLIALNTKEKIEVKLINQKYLDERLKLAKEAEEKINSTLKELAEARLLERNAVDRNDGIKRIENQVKYNTELYNNEAKHNKELHKLQSEYIKSSDVEVLKSRDFQDKMSQRGAEMMASNAKMIDLVRQGIIKETKARINSASAMDKQNKLVKTSLGDTDGQNQKMSEMLKNRSDLKDAILTNTRNYYDEQIAIKEKLKEDEADLEMKKKLQAEIDKLQGQKRLAIEQVKEEIAAAEKLTDAQREQYALERDINNMKHDTSALEVSGKNAQDSANKVLENNSLVDYGSLTDSGTGMVAGATMGLAAQSMAGGVAAGASDLSQSAENIASIKAEMAGLEEGTDEYLKMQGQLQDEYNNMKQAGLNMVNSVGDGMMAVGQMLHDVAMAQIEEERAAAEEKYAQDMKAAQDTYDLKKGILDKEKENNKDALRTNVGYAKDLAKREKQIEIEKTNAELMAKYELENKQYELDKQAFEEDKKLKLLQIGINTALGIIMAFAQSGPLLGLALAAIPAAAGALQFSAVAGSQFKGEPPKEPELLAMAAKRGMRVPSLKKILMAANGTLVRKAASGDLVQVKPNDIINAPSGGRLKGRSHAEGGIMVEAEGGEVIINKKSSEMFLPQLSKINQAGGGVPLDVSQLARGGVLPKLDKYYKFSNVGSLPTFDVGGRIRRYEGGGSLPSVDSVTGGEDFQSAKEDQVAAFKEAIADLQVWVDVKDIIFAIKREDDVRASVS